jgi:hypothetical protein
VNIGAPWLDLDEAEYRVRVMQTELHHWAAADPGHRFDDLANLVETRRSSSWPGLECGAIRAHQPLALSE